MNDQEYIEGLRCVGGTHPSRDRAERVSSVLSVSGSVSRMRGSLPHCRDTLAKAAPEISGRLGYEK